MVAGRRLPGLSTAKTAKQVAINGGDFEAALAFQERRRHWFRATGRPAAPHERATWAAWQRVAWRAPLPPAPSRASTSADSGQVEAALEGAEATVEDEFLELSPEDVQE